MKTADDGEDFQGLLAALLVKPAFISS